MGNSNSSNSYSRSETGHAKNLANFNRIILYCEGISGYNPPNAVISIADLQGLFDLTTVAFDKCDIASISFSNAVDERQLEYDGLRKLTTRVLASLSASGADGKRVDEAQTVNHKIQGRPPKTKTNESAVMQEVGEPTSNSQQSYDSLANFFRQLVEILRQTPEYAPNETDLTLASLGALSERLYALNHSVAGERVSYSNRLKERNALLYLNDDSVFERCKLVKSYVKSILGTGDPIYKEIVGIQVRNLNE